MNNEAQGKRYHITQTGIIDLEKEARRALVKRDDEVKLLVYYNALIFAGMAVLTLVGGALNFNHAIPGLFKILASFSGIVVTGTTLWSIIQIIAKKANLPIDRVKTEIENQREIYESRDSEEDKRRGFSK